MSTWEDRRAMFQPGKIVHEPSQPRRTSTASIGESKLAKTLSNESTSSAAGKAVSPVGAAAGSGFPSPGAERRRSSAASGAGMFANLHAHKRGSESYGERRSSVEDMEAGKGSAFSGWYNSTFRGMQKVKDEAAQAVGMGGAKKDERRGVME